MSDNRNTTDGVWETDMDMNRRAGVPVPCSVYRAAQLFIHVMRLIAGALALGMIADLVGISSFASNPGILDLLHRYTALVLVGIAHEMRNEL